MKPQTKPQRPEFSSGPCAKRPGWSLDALRDAALGRSHRSKIGRARLGEVIDRSRSLLGLPEGYRLGVVPASDTGAVEMALWSLLGQGGRGADMLHWESFGSGWVSDVQKQLELPGARSLGADYGELPDLSQVDFANDVVFTWNGTTSGVRVPEGDWIPDARGGLTICDATSAVFAMDLPWHKLDVTTWSWQKVLGGEAAHGMMALSPRAVARLEAEAAPRPLPKIFRLTKGQKLIEGIFKGDTINTPSMLCVEDALDALRWVESIGGVGATIARAESNLACVTEWVEKTPWVDFLAREAATRSCTSICLRFVDPWFTSLDHEAQAAKATALVNRLDAEGVAYDIGGYRDAPPGLRIWGGATVENSDLAALLPWIDWAFDAIKAEG